MRRRVRKHTGFSLIETLVAGTILSGTVLAVLAASTMSISSTRLNRQYEAAGALAEKQLTMIDFIGIDEFIDGGELEGISEDTEPVFYWNVETEYQDIDSLYRLTMTVTWIDRNHPYSLVVETMLNGESTYIEVEVEGETGAGGGGGGQAPGGGGGGGQAPGGGGGGGQTPGGGGGGGR